MSSRWDGQAEQRRSPFHRRNAPKADNRPTTLCANSGHSRPHGAPLRLTQVLCSAAFSLAAIEIGNHSAFDSGQSP